MDIVNAATSLHWIVSPLGIGIVITVTLVTLTGIPGRIALWLDAEMWSRRGGRSGRMGL